MSSLLHSEQMIFADVGNSSIDLVSEPPQYTSLRGYRIETCRWTGGELLGGRFGG